MRIYFAGPYHTQVPVNTTNKFLFKETRVVHNAGFLFYFRVNL
ncbi:hypothetical protein SAMN05518855_103423 [Paenibacillus sp. CF384]|nr:hypothetical protein SAMN05518855_103423 [Paenibacillus sp. CF384]